MSLKCIGASVDDPCSPPRPLALSPSPNCPRNRSPQRQLRNPTNPFQVGESPLLLTLQPRPQSQSPLRTMTTSPRQWRRMSLSNHRKKKWQFCHRMADPLSLKCKARLSKWVWDSERNCLLYWGLICRNCILFSPPSLELKRILSSQNGYLHHLTLILQ